MRPSRPLHSSAAPKPRLCRSVPSAPVVLDCTPPCVWLFVPFAKSMSCLARERKPFFRKEDPDHDDRHHRPS